MRKKYIFRAAVLMLTILLGMGSTDLSAQNYFTVGTGTATTTSTTAVPFSTFWHDGRHHYLVTAAELNALGASGNILGIGWDISSIGGQNINGMNIRITQTTATTAPSTFSTTATTVFSSATAIQPVLGWNQYNFPTPFSWNGVDNLLIEVCFDNGSYTSSYGFRYTAVTSQPMGDYADFNVGCTLPQPLNATQRPNMRFEFTPPFPNDAAVTALTNPTFPTCAMDSVVKVELKNFGTANLTSATVNWSVNGMLQAPNSWTGNLLPFSGDTLTLGTVAGGLNDGDVLIAWSSMPNAIPDSNNVNDTIAETLYNSLSGVYTIGTTGDFTTFTDAVNAMASFGICASTVFEVMNGTYVEQLDLTSYNGMSATNDVTFRSQSGDADSVIVSYASTGAGDNFVINFDGASYFTIENMTLQNLGSNFGRVISTPTSGGNTNITIDGCNWIGMTGANSTWNSAQYVSYIYGAGNDNWTITNNTIMNGNYGLYFYGNFSTKAKNNTVENNRFINQYYQSSYFYYQEDSKFNNNYATSNSAYAFGYGLYFGQNVRVEIKDNHVEGNTSWPNYGMYFVTMTGDLNTFMPVSGNRVVMPKLAATRGIYASNCLFVEFAHNSVYMNSTSNFNSALYFTGGSFNKIKNNILINGGTGPAMYISGSGVYEMDYNNLSAPNGNIGYTNTTHATLADWQLATGFDSNSLNVNNVMSDTATFKVCNDSLWGVGTYLPAYAMDFEGDMRQNMPCMGADEFMPISQFGFTENPVLCNGDTLVLMQGYFDTVVWNTTDTTNTYSIVAPGTQTVSVYDACGSDTSVFNVEAQVMASIGDTNLCEGTTADLETGISGGTYMWSDGSTDSTINVSAAGTVSVQVVDAYGCESADTAVVTASFDVVLPDSSTFCEGSSVVLDANMTGTYAWSNGSSNQTLAVSASGTYSVTVTDQNCISTATSNVTEILDAVPSFTDSSSYLTVVFTNTSMYATSYLWDFGDGTTSTDENPTHVYPWTNLDSMNYTVTLTAINSCGDVDAVNDGVRAGQLVSVSELELANMVSVYPNPNNGLFNVSVKTDATQEMSVEVMDVRGSLVFAQTYGQVTGEVNREVDMANAAQGIYFVKVTLDEETIVYRVSVQ